MGLRPPRGEPVSRAGDSPVCAGVPPACIFEGETPGVTAGTAAPLRRWPGWLALWGAGLLALGAGSAVAQPANDLFVNAQTLAGFSGTVTGNTVGATVEPGEPLVIDPRFGFPIPNGASVWFRWTAPASGTVSFDTFGSFFLFDTVLASYEGTNFATLIQLTAQDDALLPGTFFHSQIFWPAIAGTEYHVKLSGWFGSTGPYLLNWLMTGVVTNNPPPVVVPTEIQFESARYLVSEVAPGYATISVVYGGGAPGAVTVDYSTADGTARDGLDYIGRSGTLTFQFGETNKTFTIPILDNPEPNVDKTVNLSLANPTGGATLGAFNTAVLTIVDNETVPFLAAAGRFEFSETNYAGTEFESYQLVWNGSAFEGIHNVQGVVVTVNRVGGSTGRVLVDYTTVDDLFFGGAVAGVDYWPTNGTLVFDDGQTSTNFVVGVGTDLFSPTFNAIVPLLISNPRPAPGENPAVIVPTMGLLTNATLVVVEVLGGATIPTVLPPPAIAFTFERLNFRGVEYGRPAFNADSGTFFDTTNFNSEIEIEILLPGGGPGQVFLDLVPLYGHAPPPAFAFGQPLEAGSDNADLICGLDSFTVTNLVSTNIEYFPYPNTDYTDGSDVITNFPDIHPTLAGIRAVAGTVNIENPCRIRVTFPNAIERVSVFLPVVNDNVVEFNEDVALRLTPIGGNPPVRISGRRATATIIDDEEPSGIADRMWNPDNVFFTTNRAYNLTPGANNTVNSLAVDRNQKTVIVGDFTAYNANPRRGVARINIDGSLDLTFTPGTGANGPVTDVGIYGSLGTNVTSALSDKIVIVGIFSSFNNQPRMGIARLNPDGTLDASFNPRAGVTRNGGPGIVRSLALQSDGKVVIAGDFTHYDGIARQSVARINADGSLDTTFDTGAGPNATVWTVALLETSPPLLTGGGSFGGQAEDINVVDTGGKQGVITVNYDFLSIPDEMRIYYEGVLLTNTTYINGVGSFSINFGPGQSTIVTIVMNQGSGLIGTYWEYTASIQTIGEDKKMMIGGDFTSVNGVAINRIARLNANGALDLGFNPGGGVNGTVRAIGAQGNNKIVVGGAFDSVDFRSRNSIARFLPDGSLDTDYDPGSGFDGPVFTVLIDASGKALCGGPFKSFNGTRRVGMARLFDHGALDTGFLDTAHNQFAGLIHGLSGEARSFVSRFALQNDGNIMIGGSFTNIGCMHTIDLCETNIIPRVGAIGAFSLFTLTPFEVLFERHVWNRQEKRARYNVARLIGGRTPGPGNVRFTYADYGADEGTGDFTVTMSRVDGRLGTLLGDVATSNRTAQAGADFPFTKTTPTWPEDAYVAPYSIGYVEPQYFIIPLTNDDLREGDEIFDLGLFNPVGSVFLGGEFIPLGGAISRSHAPATIADDDFDHGIMAFAKPVFTASEGATNLTVTLVRTNGSSGLVTVDYFFRNGTAFGGVDFTNLQDRTLFTAIFGQGITRIDIQIPIFDDVIAEPDKTFFMVLTNATGGAKLPGGQLTSDLTANLVIIDNDHASGRLNFIQANFITNEFSGSAIITVARIDGSVGPLSVDVTATSGTAIAGVDFVGITNRLSWVNGDTANKQVIVPLIVDGLVEPNETVNLALVNFSASSGIGFQTTATLTIGNDDAFGTLVFSQPIYDANENGTNVTIIVNRVRGVAGTVSCTFQTEDGTAADGLDYLGTNGTLVFGPGEFSKSFQVTLLNNSVSDGDRVVTLRITNFVLTAGGPVTVALLRIIDDESVNTPAGSLDTTLDPLAGANSPVYALALQSDGKILIGGDFRSVNHVTRNRMARLHPNGLLDPTFNAGLGPNRPVRAIAPQPDGRLIIGGFFDRVHGTNRAHIARMLSDGSLDIFFDPGAGADNPVFSLALAPDGQVVVGGSFTTFDGIPRAGIVMLNTNGTVDASFNPGEGANGTVYAVAIQGDGKVVLGGDFTIVGRTFRPGIARLNRDGSLDLSFNLGEGPNGTVRAITLQADGGILLGGSFTTVDGNPRGGLARLNPDGAVDPLFLPPTSGDGANGSVLDIELQADGNLIVAGDFTIFNGVTRRRITRLLPNGKTDPTINFGEGANSFIAAAVIQPDRRIVIGGGFTSVQGQTRNSIARLYGGSIAGPGSIEYSRSSYLVTENAGQATITVRRTGGTTGEVTAEAATSPGTALPGLDYTNVTASLFFPEGEVEQTFVVPLVNDIVIEPDETVLLSLANLTGGATLGEVPDATLVIQSDDSLVGFSGPSYTVNENAIAGYAPITVVRSGTTNSSVSIDYLTRPGTATASEDYTNVTDTLTFAPGETLKTFQVPIVNDPFVEGPETVGLFLTNITGASQLGISSATLVIVDDDFSPGLIQFASPNYVVNEYETNAVITVVRIGGTFGIVTVDFDTSPGTAQPGSDYQPRSGQLTFADGVSVNTFNVPIVPDFEAETNETVTLTLMRAGGATIGSNSTAILTILNNNLTNGAFSFTATNYTATESNRSVTLAVARQFGTGGSVSVDYRTVSGTASNGVDFIAVTNTLFWANGDSSPKLITDIVLVDDALVEEPETFTVQLFNPTGGAIVGARGTTTVTILDEDVGPGFLGFSTGTYVVSENATNALITVTRLAGRTGVVAVDVATVPGGSAVAGLDYAPASTNLVFLDGQRSNTFVVTVTNNLIVEGDKTILLSLSNPTGGASTNGRIISATLAILEDDQPAGSIDAGFGGTGADGPVDVVGVQTNNNKLFVGGEFTKFSGADRSHIVRLNQSGSVDTTFDPGTNINNSVRALAVQPDGRLLIGGLFTNVANNVISYLARLSTDGSQDQEFLSGLSGVDNVVDAIALQTDSRIVIGGSFTTVNGLSLSRIARLEANGALDPGFNPGTGANGDVHAVALAADGAILAGGDFSIFNGVSAGGIVRLRPNGSIDPTFSTGLGFDDSVRAIVIQPGDNKILVAGYFSGYSPTLTSFVPRAGVLRLNVDGSLDPTFNPGSGANEYINALALQPDGKILVGGGFTLFNGVERNHLARLNSNGSIDFTFNIGSGADNYINTIALQTDRKIIIGGGFRHFDGAPRNFIARLAGGDNVGSGQFAFSDPIYNVLENSTNATITVRRLVGTSNAVSVAFATADGTALASTHYVATNGTLFFGPGETVRTLVLPVIDDIATNADRTLTLQLSNPTGGASLGFPAVATVNLINDDSALLFTVPRFSASESQGSNVVITVQRAGSQVGTVTVNFATGTNGTATPGLDFFAQAGQLVFTNGQTVASFLVPIIDDTLIEVNETVALQLFNQTRTYPAGNVSIDVPTAVLEIVDDDFGIGLIGFATSNFTVSERGGAATITVTRAGGSAGAASVFFALSLGLTNAATPGLDYINTNGLLVFGDGQTVKTFTVPIFDDTLVEGPEQIRLNLFNVTGAALGLSSATLTILADEAVFSFSQPVFVVNENGGSALITVSRSPQGTGPVSVGFATSDNTALDGLDYRGTNGTLVFAPGQLTASFRVPIIDDNLGEGNELLTLTLLNPRGESTLAGGTNVASLVIVDNDVSFSFLATNFAVLETDGTVDIQVVRRGRTNGTDSVEFNTSDGTAIAGQDYAFTNLTLVFAPGEVLKTVSIIIRDDAVGEGTEFFNLNLVNPSLGSTVGVPGTATVSIFDDEDTVSFGAAAFSVDESAGTAFVTVTRNGAFPFATVTVQFQTMAGTATVGLDYTNVSGQLTFGFGETFKFIPIPITDDLLIEGDETFTVRLFNASGAALISPSNAVVTIVENDTSVSFGAATFSVSETVSNAAIPVIRSGGTAGTVTVQAFTTNGTATAGVDYVGTNVSIVFPPGVTSQSLVIRLNDDLLIEGNETVGLRLVNPIGAVLGTPSTATLTILDEDASIIVPAGSSIVSENYLPPSGVIDPGERVTVNFGLRNIGNVDTLNLVATLLNSNGVTLSSGAQPFGVVAASGAVVSMQFTFTATGTNGGRITAVLRLQDGANNLGTVSFDFTLGLNANNFVNSGGAAINDRGPASPYPMTNIVSGLAGLITKLTVTVANISHTFPDDIDILLVGPGGQKAVLMSDAGSSSSSANPIANVTIKFDDAAATSIPDSNQIVSATYRPANWFGVGSADSFPGIPGPYTNSSLSIFSNTPPNGVWSLYVVDDETGDIGNIAGGWSLGITTTESIVPLADLSIAATDGPDPIAAGDTLTYTILVMNNGPSVATGVVLTNTLPPGMNFISVSPTNICSNAGSIVTCNFGTLGSGVSSNVTILGAPTLPGTITSLATVSGGQMDVVPANNSFSIKTSVVPLTLAIAIAHEGTDCVLRWPAPAAGYTLQYANSLRSASWTNYPVAPVVANGMNSVIVSMTNNARYFRLRAP